jgi:hypothetical protein
MVEGGHYEDRTHRPEMRMGEYLCVCVGGGGRDGKAAAPCHVSQIRQGPGHPPIGRGTASLSLSLTRSVNSYDLALGTFSLVAGSDSEGRAWASPRRGTAS